MSALAPVHDSCPAAAVFRKKEEKTTHEEDSLGTISMSATDQLDLTDFVLTVYEDDDYEDKTRPKKPDDE